MEYAVEDSDYERGRILEENDALRQNNNDLNERIDILLTNIRLLES